MRVKNLMMILTRLKVIAVLSVLCFVSMNPAEGTGLKGKLSSGGSSALAVRTSSRSVLPAKGDIAVIADGGAEQYYGSVAESMIVESLVGRGYRVVDEAKMKKIRAAAAKNKAARLALEGNVEGILKINASYSAAATIVARVQTGKAVLNEFNLYTATSSVSIMAVTSNGTKLGGKTVMGKAVGYTEDEAQYNALSSAVESAMEQL